MAEDQPALPSVAAWRDWRWWLRTVGKGLIVNGLLLLGFVGYQLWGTGIENSRTQSALADDFEELLASTTTTAPSTSTTLAATTAPSRTTAGSTTTTTATSTTTPATTATTPATTTTVAPPPEGDPIALMEIPSIGLEEIVVEGVSLEALRKGPGHYPATPMPGRLGNAAIAGHRTTYGQPFFDIDELVPGDEITVTTVAGRYVYAVTGTEIVGAEDVQVVATTDPTIAELTLTSCHPKWSASRRIVVHSLLVDDRSDPVPRPTTTTGTTTTSTTTSTSTTSTTSTTTAASTVGGSTTEPGTATAVTNEVAPTTSSPAVAEQAADAFSDGWFHDTAAIPHVVLWGLAVLAVAIGARRVGRRIHPGPPGLAASFAIGVMPFAVFLYFFYQNVNRLLPPSL